MASSPVCRICGNTHNNRQITVLEMLYGTKEEFAYFECSSCATLQILDIPENLSRYYPSDYLGRVSSQDEGREHDNAIRIFLRQQRALYLMYGKSWVGWIASKIGQDYFGYNWEWFRKSSVTPDSRILDVGCGSGLLLRNLQDQGFLHLSGVDPFQEKTIPGIKIHRCELSEYTGEHDLIMLHHSLEHVADPVGMLVDVKRLCSPGGRILVRIPVADCHAWKQYGINWFQIDAPRHLVIPSLRGMQIISERVGLSLSEIVFDSDELQFCCSEQYKEGIPLKDPRSYHRNRDKSSFTPAQIESFKQQSRELNQDRRGDQACFYFENQSA